MSVLRVKWIILYIHNIEESSYVWSLYIIIYYCVYQTNVYFLFVCGGDCVEIFFSFLKRVQLRPRAREITSRLTRGIVCTAALYGLGRRTASATIYIPTSLFLCIMYIVIFHYYYYYYFFLPLPFLCRM